VGAAAPKAGPPPPRLFARPENPPDHPAALIVAREGDIGVIKKGCICVEGIEEIESVAGSATFSTEVYAHRVGRTETERSLAAKALMAPTVAALGTDIDAGPVLDYRHRSRWRGFS